MRWHGRSGSRHVARAAIVLPLVLWGPARVAFAQGELAGSWAPLVHEIPLSDDVPTDYTGLALNDEGRAKALSYSQSQLAMIERQCQGWPPFYFVRGPEAFGLKIWSDTDLVKGTVISWTVGAWEDRPALVVWMNGRPHPSPYAEHTRGGFTTGTWEGSTLVARTTHIKAGFLKRNGVPLSDMATMTTRFLRHGEWLTLLTIIEDPVYLEEPLLLSKTYRLTTAYVSPIGPPCVSTFEGTAQDSVPHYVPEENPFIDEMTRKYGIPREAALGHVETLYPEYQRTLRARPAGP